MQPFTEKVFTNRLLLRRILREDLETLWRWSRSPGSYGDFLSPEHLVKDDLLQRYMAGMFWSEKEKLFLIEKRGGAALGTIHYWLSSGRQDTATVAVKIAEPAERNKGYGTEAQKFLLIYLFDKIKVQHVEMYTDLDNLAQQRCLKKLGFSLIETLTYDDSGIRRTGNLYRISRPVYLQEAIYRYHYE
ncbi:MAG: GNAT family N-acetyltransferase [Desulfopila sp.]|nr:GNAT family N-acetyltransferase [Desulfopila sp.]